MLGGELSQVAQPERRVAVRVSFLRILLGLEDDPPRVGSQLAEHAIEGDTAIARDRENTFHHRTQKAPIAVQGALGKRRAHILGVHVPYPACVAAGQCRRVGARESRMRRMASYTTHTVSNSNSWPLTNAASG